MRITLGIGVARIGVNETITGLWTFANVLGLLTDIIGERTSAAGVTVDGLLIRDSGIPAAAVTAHEAALAILMSQVTGNIPDGQVPASAVTQHQAALAILMSQVSGNIPDGQVPESAVTQHEAALAILETQITDGTLLARLAANEVIAGNWEFDGSMDVDGDLIYDHLDVTSGSNLANLATAGATIQRINNTGIISISGFADGVDGRIIVVQALHSTSALSLLNDNAGSSAANRILCPDNTTYVLGDESGVMLWYDGTTSRWRVVGGKA